MRDAPPPSTARGVHHVALLCSDVEQTVRFYQDLLEFPLTDMFENRDYQGSTHFFFDLGNGNALAFFDFPGLDLGPYAEVLGGLQHLAHLGSARQLGAPEGQARRRRGRVRPRQRLVAVLPRPRRRAARADQRPARRDVRNAIHVRKPGPMRGFRRSRGGRLALPQTPRLTAYGGTLEP